MEYALIIRDATTCSHHGHFSPLYLVHVNLPSQFRDLAGQWFVHNLIAVRHAISFFRVHDRQQPTPRLFVDWTLFVCWKIIRNPVRQEGHRLIYKVVDLLEREKGEEN